MPQTFDSPDFGTLTIPGAAVNLRVQNAGGGLAATGILALVGEADAGPDFTLEGDLRLNAFGPDQLGAVRAKYRSGRLVDAARAASNPIDDRDVVGSVSRIIFVKTNPSGKASLGLLEWDASAYGTLYDRSYGRAGNNVSAVVTAATAEVIPTTGAFTWVNPAGTVNADLRVSGGAKLALALSANTTPTAFVSAANALAGVAATGGAARTTIQNSVGTLAVGSISGNSATFTYASGTFTTTPSVGDTLSVPAASAIAGSGNANVGAWVVTAATSTTVAATKLSDAAKPGAVPGTITAPAAVSATSVTSTAANDLVVYSPATVTLEAADPSPGLGKTLELSELATGTDLLSRCTRALSATAVTWVSTAASPTVLTSASEYRADLELARQTDNASESLVAGGDVALSVGYEGTTGSMTVTATALTTVVTGGSGGNLSLTLSDFPTLADLVAYLNSQTGYSATAGSAALGTMPPTALDRGTFGIGTDWGAETGRVKVDALRFSQAVAQSALVQLGNPVARASAGLPGPSGPSFLSGGTRGATTQATYQAAVDALERVTCNFVCPLFSRDAAGDIADGLTDPSSTYQIAAVNAYMKAHVLALSKPKRARNRQAALSFRGTFAAARSAAAAINSGSCTMSFLDQKVSSDSGIVQAQPWMDAVIAAAGQLAAFRLAVFAKNKVVSGSLQAAGDWSDASDTNLEDALRAGLLPTRNGDDGTFQFASDQTTWSTDTSFFYNSMQAVYAANVIALTLKQNVERKFLGRSLADVGAAGIRSEMKAQLRDLLRLRLTAASDGAPRGFDERSLTVNVQAPAAIVGVNVFLATALYFFPITVGINPVTQSA